ALQEDRPWRAFVAIQCTAGDAGNDLIGDDRTSVEHDGHAAPYERDVVRLPLARAGGGVLVRCQEAVDTTNVQGCRPVALGTVLDLHLVAPTQIHAAVPALRVTELEMQLEVDELARRHQVGAARRVREHTIHGSPMVLAAALRGPSGEILPVEQVDRRSP